MNLFKVPFTSAVCVVFVNPLLDDKEVHESEEAVQDEESSDDLEHED